MNILLKLSFSRILEKPSYCSRSKTSLPSSRMMGSYSKNDPFSNSYFLKTCMKLNRHKYVCVYLRY